MLLILIIFIFLVLSYQLHFVLTFKQISGDYAVGQAYVMFFIATVLTISMLLYFLIVCYKSNFQWLSAKQGVRILVLSTFCITLLLTLFFSYYFAIEWHGGKFPYFLKLVASSGGYFWLAICAIVPFYFLAGSSNPPSVWVQHLIRFDIAICYIYVLSLGYGLLNEYNYLPSFNSSGKVEEVDEFQLKLIEDIKSYPDEKSIYGLLSGSDIIRPEIVHKAALQKIKDRNGWEDQILDILEDRESYQESYLFLRGNPVDHPEKFKYAFKRSIKFLEQDAVNRIKNENRLEKWALDFINLDAMLGSIDTQFKGEAAQFVPLIEQLRKSIIMNTPEDHKKVKLNAIKGIDHWLKKHRN